MAQRGSDISRYLKAACPSWKPSQLILAEGKLGRVGIHGVAELLEVISVSVDTLNQLIIAADEKPFEADIVQALKETAQKLYPNSFAESPAAPAQRPAPAPSMRDRFNGAKSQQNSSHLDDAAKTPQNGYSPAQAAAPSSTAPPKVEIEEDETDQGRMKRLKDRQSGLLTQMAQSTGGAVAVNKQLGAITDEIKRLEWAMRGGTAAASKKAANAQRAENDNSQNWLKSSTTVGQKTEVEWFGAISKQVSIKRATHKYAKSWGFVTQNTLLQVFPSRVQDELGQEWVQLTRFGLWRSCLRDATKVIEEAPAYALIEATKDPKLAELGPLLKGPLSEGEFQVPHPNELETFGLWCQARDTPNAASNARDTPKPAFTSKASVPLSAVASATPSAPSTRSHKFHKSYDADPEREVIPGPRDNKQSFATEPSLGPQDFAQVDHARPTVPTEPPRPTGPTERYEVMHNKLTVHAKPRLESDVIGTKRIGEILTVVEGEENGWMKLANEPGWVCFDIAKDTESDAKTKKAMRTKALLQRAKINHRVVASRNMDVAGLCETEARAELVSALEAYDRLDIKICVLERAVLNARSSGVEEGRVFDAENLLEGLLMEGEHGRYVRVMKTKLAEATSTSVVRKLYEKIIDYSAELPEAEAEEQAETLAALLDEARYTLDNLLLMDEETSRKNDSVLERLTAAVKSGDTSAIKAARDAAKEAGVPKKELARIFALATAG